MQSIYLLMIRGVFLSLLTIFSGLFNALAQEGKVQEYEISIDKSSISWKASKTDESHYGSLKFLNGTFNVQDEVLINGKAFVDMTTIKCTSINDAEDNRAMVELLSSSVFFDEVKYPFSTIKIHGIQPIENSDKFNYIIEGSLTVKGYSTDVSFPAKVEFKDEKMGASGSLELDRTQYGITYHSGNHEKDLPEEDLIYDTFSITVQIVAERK